MLEWFFQSIAGIGFSTDSGEFLWLWPWVFWLLPVPLLGYLLPPVQAPNQQAVALPFWSDMAGSSAQQGRSAWYWRVLAVLMWVLLILAAARPQFVGEIRQLPVSGRDLLLAVDISGSMDTEDMVVGSRTTTRLNAVKSIAGDFIERRAGDRTGLILFGDKAYLQVPLTFDRNTTATVLRDSTIGLAGKKTAIGDAIGLAVKRLRESDDRPNPDQNGARQGHDFIQQLDPNANAEDLLEREHAVLILLTDGANTAGALEPVQAAEFAQQAGMKIYTIGIGADRMLVRDFFGQRAVNPSADLDEDALQQIADLTNGRYFRARDPADLNQIYQILDELEPIAEDEQTIRPVNELFYWPLGALLALSMLVALLASLPQFLMSLFKGQSNGSGHGKGQQQSRVIQEARVVQEARVIKEVQRG